VASRSNTPFSSSSGPIREAFRAHPDAR
jgi:hypothetical protein